ERTPKGRCQRLAEKRLAETRGALQQYMAARNHRDGEGANDRSEADHPAAECLLKPGFQRLQCTAHSSFLSTRDIKVCILTRSTWPPACARACSRASSESPNPGERAPPASRSHTGSPSSASPNVRRAALKKFSKRRAAAVAGVRVLAKKSPVAPMIAVTSSGFQT